MHPTRWLAVRVGGQPRWAPYIVKIDLLLRRLTGGRITLLLCVPSDGSWLVAGSNWGGPKAPQWVGNLIAADSATVSFRGRDTVVSASLLVGVERATAWQEMLEVWPNYARYASRTGREIPVFRLTPLT